MAAGLNDTPSGERTAIGVFGRTNAGKSTIFNAITGQDKAIVSEISGTTTDPVQKAMEILPIGPVLLMDTPGLSDESALGSRRMAKTREVLRKSDMALLVVDASDPGDLSPEQHLMQDLTLRRVPVLLVLNKMDRVKDPAAAEAHIMKKMSGDTPALRFSSEEPQCGVTVETLRETLAGLKPAGEERLIIGGRLCPGDTVVLVIPIDESAPKGRLILPQVLVMREILDAGASALALQPEQLAGALENLNRPPRLVITDSQAFRQVAPLVPPEISLTSFSILMAGYKGDLPLQIDGARQAPLLKENSTVLIAEGCTHHRQCNDIGSVQIPAMIDKLSGHKLNYHFTSGGEFPEELDYDLIVHCGGCMQNAREMRYRMRRAASAGVPITNYGVLMAFANGILDRVTRI